jgi:hypothetical protein
MKKSKQGNQLKKSDLNKFRRFIEELTWLMDSYSDLDIKSAIRLLENRMDEPIEAKEAFGSFQSTNPNKHFLVGVLPRLFTDRALFPSNDDIAQFAQVILNIDIPHYHKRSKLEIIGHIVCQTNKLNDEGLTKLVKALGKISGDDKKKKEVAKKRKLENFGWNAIIQELASQE